MAVGWIVMSERELNRIEVLSEVSQGRTTVTAAASVLGLSRRQVHRLLKSFETEGAASRGRPSGVSMEERLSIPTPPSTRISA